MRLPPLGSAIAMILAVAGLCVPALSQENPAAEDSLPTYTMEARVITADRCVNRLASSTSAVSVLTAEEIRQGPWTKLPDLFQSVPGFFLFNRDGVGRDAIVSTRGFYGAGEAEYVQVLLDGKQINDLETGLVDWNLVPLNSISSVEVARGASSAAYGDAAMGGVISISTKNDPASIRNLTFSGGMYGAYDAGLQARGRVSGNPYQLSLSGEETKGFRDHSKWHAFTLGGDIVFGHDAAGTLRLSTLNQWSKSEDPGPLSAAEVISNREWSSPYYRNDGKNEQRYQAQMDYSYAISTASDLQADIFFKHKNSDIIRTYPSPPVIINPADGSVSGVYDTTMYGDSKEREIPTTEYGLSVQYNLTHSVGSMRNRMSVGFDGVYGSLRSTYYAQFGGFEQDYAAADFFRGMMIADGNSHRIKYALFINDELQILDPMKLIVGLRYDALRDTYTGTSTDATISANNSLVSPKVGVNFEYLRTEKYSGNMYAAVNGSFKAPTLDQSFDQRPLNAGFFVPAGQDSFSFLPVTLDPFSNPQLKPQRATSYEAGLYQEGKILSNLYAEITMSIYRINVRDEIDFDLSTFKYANIQESRHDGAEIGARIYWLPGVTAYLNYTLTNVTFQTGPNADNELKGIPRSVTTVGARYSHPVGLSLSVAWNFMNDVYLDDENTTRLPNYNHGSAKISLSLSPLTLSVDVENLANARYSSTGYLLSGETFLYPAAGRAVYAGLGLEF